MDCRNLLVGCAVTAITALVSAQIVTPAQTRPATTVPATQQGIPDIDKILQNLVQNSGTTQGGAAVQLNASGPDSISQFREGQLLYNFAGHLQKNPDNGEMMFIFDKEQKTSTGTREGYTPMPMVPSRRLMLMEDATTAAGMEKPRTFHVTAEVTQYRGKNYLYIKNEPVEGAAPATAPSMTLTPQVEAAAPNEPTAIRLREAETITNRIVRLVRDPKTGVSVIAFDSDGKDMRDPPMAAIPGKWLAMMEDASEMGLKAAKFRVSGEVTAYRGKNYLYVRAAQIVRDMNQGVGPGSPVGF